MIIEDLISKIESDMNESTVPGDFYYEEEKEIYHFYVISWFEDDNILASISCTYHDNFFYDNEMKKVNVSKYLVDNSK
tara:strand:- start:89 stop:322 length:234 start_codon:yes stop_codon:yes gene_type:complete